MDELERIKPFLQQEEAVEIYQELERCCEAIEEKIEQGIYQKAAAEREVLQLLSSELMYDSYFIYLLSFAVKCFKNPEHLELLCDLVATNDYMSPMSRKFALHQIKAFLIRCPELETANVKKLIGSLEEQIRAYLLSCYQIKRRPKEQRSDGKVLVLTHGFLGEAHPVSRSALERCVSLQKELGKEVQLISTGEDCTMEDSVPLYHIEVRNRNEQFDGNHVYEYRGEQIALYQPVSPANNLTAIRDLLVSVIESNPQFVVYVGEQSFVADLINEFCPVLAVSTTFSVLQRTHTEFVMVGRKATPQEKEQSYGEVLESLFTFQLKEKKRTYTREGLGIPEGRFVLAVVGTRLDSDVNLEFLYAMQPLMEKNCHLLFVGKFDSYERWCKKLPWLRAYSTSLGMVDDVTGILTCADLYVNPNRLGGGFSVAEGFDAGIPAVTTPYGDVAVAAGEAFWVKDYGEMVSQIKKYRSDEGFYDTMVAAAKRRLEELTGESGSFAKAVQSMLESPRFY